MKVFKVKKRHEKLHLTILLWLTLKFLCWQHMFGTLQRQQPEDLSRGEPKQVMHDLLRQ